MPSSYTPSLRFEQPSNGEQNGTWGDTLDRQMQLIDLAVAGIAVVSTQGGTVVLSANDGLDDQARRAVLQLTGTLTANLTVVFPAGASKVINIRNYLQGAAGFSLTLQVAGSGSPAVYPASVGGLFFCDGSGIDWLSPTVGFGNLAVLGVQTVGGSLDPIGQGVPGSVFRGGSIQVNAPPGSAAASLSASYAPGIGANGILSELYAGSAAYPVGSITTNGASTAYNVTSDHRAKDRLRPLWGALARLGRLPVYRGVYRAAPNREVDMVLAHEAARVVPESVWGAKNAVDAEGEPVLQQWDASKMVPLLIAALKEAAERIETLEERLDASWPARLLGR